MYKSVFFQPCTKSEDDFTAMLRIINFYDEPIKIESLKIPGHPEKDKYLSNFSGVLILPNEQFRLYLVGDDYVNPPQEEFDLIASYDIIKELDILNSNTSVRTHISYKFRNSFITIKNNGQVLLNKLDCDDITIKEGENE